MERIATVVIVTNNQKEMLRCSLGWLKDISEIADIIIVDNGSTDGTTEFLDEFGYNYIFFNEGTQGYGKAWNAALVNFETEDIIIIMEPQYLPGKKCILRLAELLKKDNCGIAAPMCNNGFTDQYIAMDGWEKLAELEDISIEERTKELKTLDIGYGFWAFSKEVWNEQGMFDEELLNPGNVFLDYKLRLVRKGRLPVVCRDAFAYDLSQGTLTFRFGIMPEGPDREVLKKKWNMDYYNFRSNRAIIDLISEEYNMPIRVLEIGCDLGATLLGIKNKHPNSDICGLEINDASVEIARHLADVKIGNIEDMDIPFEGKFDYIIFADVLEHLHNPAGVVKFCRDKLNDDGCILASIPNVMHISVMEQLLHGRFHYTDNGLLDQSHIHLFTYYEIQRMFLEAGYEVEKVNTTSIALTEEQEKLKVKLMEISQNVEMHMYQTFQYLVKARRTHKKMDNVEKLQKLIDTVIQTPYHGVYLWKYVEYELTSGIIMDYQNQERNVCFQGLSDYIPDASPEEEKATEELLSHLEEKEILFGMIPLRRPYNEKLYHTAMDAYVDVMDVDKYVVIEPNLGGQEDEIVHTKNRVRFYPLGVIGKYGQDITDKNEIAEFLITHYIKPIEQEFHIVFPEQALLKCIYKLSSVLKERRAYLSFFEEVLDRIKPKIVCYTHGSDPILCFLRETARKKGIPTLEIEHGAAIRNLMYPDFLAYSDYSLTHSDILTKPMLEKGFKNVITVGKPHVYEEVFQNINLNGPIVVSFISSLEKDLFLKALDLAKRLDKKKYLVLFKLHSVEELSQEESDKILEENENWQFLDGIIDVREVYAVSDIVVGVRSSGILDALPFHKTKVLALEDKYEKDLIVNNFSFFNELAAKGDIVIVKDGEELYQEIINYKRGEDYRGVINHYWPEDSEKRFKELIQIFLEGGRP